MKNTKIILLLVVSSFLVKPLWAQGVFSNESEASVVISGGNSDLEVYNFKTRNNYEKEKNKYTIAGHYTYGTSEEELSARNWSGLLRYDRSFTKHLGGFVAYLYEQDKLRGFEYRQNHDLGGTYTFLKTDRQSLSTEIGYRLTREKALLATKTESYQKTRYAMTYEFKGASNWSMRFFQELVLNHTEAAHTIYTAEPSLNMALNSKVSFKFGYRGIYENRPSQVGNRKYDYQFTSGLIAKF